MKNAAYNNKPRLIIDKYNYQNRSKRDFCFI